MAIAILATTLTAPIIPHSAGSTAWRRLRQSGVSSVPGGFTLPAMDGVSSSVPSEIAVSKRLREQAIRRRSMSYKDCWYRDASRIPAPRVSVDPPVHLLAGPSGVPGLIEVG